MYLRDLFEQPDQWAEYEKLLTKLSMFVDKCSKLLIDAFYVAQSNALKEHCYSHATTLMLTRHIIESVDGVSVLVQSGCAENCSPLLRSAFEGQLGLLYILEADSKNRAMAYQVAHAHRKIKMYRKYDPNEQLGKQFRAELQNESEAAIFSRVPGDLSKMVANLEKMLMKQEYQTVETEWQVASKKKKNPEWFSLWGGPSDVRSLAFHLQLGTMYESLYRMWSNVIHAGSGFNHVGASDQPGAISIRPLRHPEGIEAVCSIAAQICLSSSRSLVKRFDPTQADKFARTYEENIRPEYLQVSREKLINAPWC